MSVPSGELSTDHGRSAPRGAGTRIQALKSTPLPRKGNLRGTGASPPGAGQRVWQGQERGAAGDPDGLSRAGLPPPGRAGLSPPDPAGDGRRLRAQRRERAAGRGLVTRPRGGQGRAETSLSRRPEPCGPYLVFPPRLLWHFRGPKKAFPARAAAAGPARARARTARGSRAGPGRAGRRSGRRAGRCRAPLLGAAAGR